MNNASAVLRSVITYALCVVLAVFVGYQLTDPLTRSTFVAVGLLILVMASPILLRWHHLLLLLSWNLVAVLFFLPGSPNLWLAMVALSLFISIFQRALNRELRFISVPQVAWPLICLAVVAIVTAELTGGIGVRALGSDVFGGRRYIYLIGAILGYFALTAQRIPQERAGLYVAMFFLGGLTGIIGDLVAWVTPSFYFIFWMFPPNLNALQEGSFEVGASRMGSAGPVAFAVFFYMLARYGIRGVLDLTKPWRLAILVCFTALGFLGGFRGVVIGLGLAFLAQFFLEGLHRTKLLPATVLGGVLLAAILVPLAPKMPYMFQRTLTVVPFLELDPLVRLDAQSTVDWRFQMWKAVAREVPKHLLLGKGYALSSFDFDFMKTRQEGNVSAENWDSAIAGDYHNGPLSVIIPFGIWGAMAFLWFIVASLRVMHANCRHGPPELRMYSTLLLAAFISKTVVFFLVGGGLYNDMVIFAGFIGLSVSLNGGVCRPSPSNVPETQKTEGVAGMLPRPAFQRS